MERQKLRMLSEVVRNKQGSFEVVTQWYEGWQPKLGTFIQGWTGPETRVEKTKIKPVVIFKGGQNEL